MNIENITLVYKTLLNLDINKGLVMKNTNQSIAIIKRKDNKGIYYSINDTINNIPQKVYHDECPMTLILLNKDRFKHDVYQSKISLFS